MLGDFLDAVDIPKSRVINHPRYVFLCGGRVPTGTSGRKSPPISLRQTLLEAIARNHPDLKSDILLAESIFSAFDEAHYKDLLRFERDLAYLCSAIIIIVESAGAIAELGAFVLLDPVRDKLYAILDESHYNAPSFIRRGPVEYLKSHNDNRVYSYNWLTASGHRPSISKIRTFGQDLIDDISRIHRDMPASPSLDLASRSHHMLLTVSLLRIAQPLTLSEIHQFLNLLHGTTSLSDVQQYLAILRSLNLITKKRYGHIDYYFNKDGTNFIRWAFKNAARSRDVTRWMMDYKAWLKSNDKTRFNALRALHDGK